MSAHSPRLRSRVSSLVVAVLLVGSLVAPAFVGSAAASTTTADDGMIDGSFEGTCDSKLKFAFPISCPVGYEPTTVDESNSDSIIKTDIHVGAQGVYESQLSTETVYSNYLEDTETLARLEARDAIATAYENNESAAVAQGKATEAIRDYYSVHQRNLLEEMNGQTAQLFYYSNVTEQHSIDNRYLHMYPMDGSDTCAGGATACQSWSITEPNPRFEKGLNDSPVQLINGTEANVSTFQHSWVYDRYGEKTVNKTFNPVAHWNTDTENFGTYVEVIDSSNDEEWHYTLNGKAFIQSHADAGLHGQQIYAYADYMRLWDKLENQSASVVNSFPQSLADDMYAEMDAGNLDPNDIRGAEGMIRYMSGGSTDGEAFELALRHTLDLEQPESMDSTMVVDFEGKTDRVRDPVNETVTYSQVNTTYEGLLFASGVPNGTLETGVTYNVSSDFNATPSMLVNGSEKRFYSGNLTVREMYDSDGNSIETMNYGGPEYQSYNSDEFIAALENIAQERQEIVDEEDENDGSDIGWPNPFGGDGPGGIVGIAIIAVVMLAVVGFVTDLIPGLGS